MAAGGWREALSAYRHRRVLAMWFLGFAAGLPYLLVFSTLSTWLREAGIDRATIGFLSWVGAFYSIKVLWAPLVDGVALPGLTRRLGRRRAWMLLAQVGIIAGLVGMAASDPTDGLSAMVAFALLVAFASATQDIAIDAYRIEAVAVELQGAMAASYNFGYRVALLAAGAGALYVAEYRSWPAAYGLMAAAMLFGIATVALIAEPEVRPDRQAGLGEARARRYLAGRGGLSPALQAVAAWLYGATVSPFVDFFRRNGRLALAILAFIGIYKLSDIVMGVMANPFYIDLGFSKAEIASVTKLYGFVMSVAGGIAGGLLVARFGIAGPLLVGAVLVGAPNLIFALLAGAGPDLGLLAAAISADNLGAGLAGTVLIAYLSSLTSTAYTATQYALFSSFMSLPGRFLGGWSGVMVDDLGYARFFVVTAVLSLPAIVLAHYLARRTAAMRPAPAAR